MALDGSPRVTLGIATYNRATYLAAAIGSVLEQDFADLEVLVVLDGTTNPETDEVLKALAGDPRLRVVRHPRNLGIAAAYNTFISEGRGELIAMLGDDDRCLPGRIRRQVEVFDRHPETGVVHGDAIVIDDQGRQTGVWPSVDLTGGALLRSFWRSHNHLVDPTRMVHRRVYEDIGGYDGAFPLANDFDLWLRAAPRHRFRHCGGAPLTAVRRHGENASDESARAREVDDVERALEAALARDSLRDLVPELDWGVLDEREAERQALERLAAGLERRQLPLPGLGSRLRRRAQELQPSAGPARRARPSSRGRLLMTSFGFNDSGGGTTVPRLAAKELVNRGWEVTVFHAATRPTETGNPYEVREWSEDGVRLIGVHNRSHGLFDIGNPLREIDDPPITAAFEQALDRSRPDVVHFHNLHNLGAALIDRAAARGVPAYFTTHNYWLICPRAYLLDGNGRLCPGPGDGSACAACVGSVDTGSHQRRLAEIRARAQRGLTAVLAVSDAVRRTLLNAGYPPELIDTVRQAMPHEGEIWERVGRHRAPGRVGDRLTVAFLGSAYPHKGPQLLIDAAQRTAATIDVRIVGEVPREFERRLHALDQRGVVDFTGSFSPSEIPGLLGGVDVVALPSMWWDCAPLAAAECLAARTPVLVPRLGGLPEAIRDGVDGLAFDGLDPVDLAAKLDRLASEPGLLERLQSGIEPPRAFSDYVDELERYYAGERPSMAIDERPACRAVRWQGDHGQPTSLSIINDRICERLPGSLQRINRDGSPVPGAPLPHTADVEVRHQWPPDLSPPRAGRLALIQPWEFGAIPEDWLEPIGANVDELWVPSEHVRGMYLDAGIEPERVVAIPNGVDSELFSPDGPRRELPEPGATRFLFVGGLVGRKGADILFDCWREAFAGRDDVTLVVKDFGADGIYRAGDRGPLREHAASGALPRIVLLDEVLSAPDLAALYRACDVLVHPYRGEGFAMPVLEAMACGLPVIVTAGGPTDEFVPAEAGWRIDSRRLELPEDRIEHLATRGTPWLLEPDRAHLVALLREAAATPAERRRVRGTAGRAAAERLSWDEVAARYQRRIEQLVTRQPRATLPAGADPEPFPLAEEVALRILATPAWRGQDRLGDLLAAWVALTGSSTSACLYLLADPAIDGAPEQLEARVLEAAAASGADLTTGADINVLMEPGRPERDPRLHAAMDAYVPLHAACRGHERLAAAAGCRIVSPGQTALAELLGPASIASVAPGATAVASRA